MILSACAWSRSASVLDDLQRARGGNHAWPIQPPKALQLALVDRHALDGEIDRGNLVEQEIETALRRALDQLEAAGSHPQGRMRLLGRARLDDDVVEVPAPAVMREAALGGPGFAQEGHGLLEALGRLLDGNAEARELVLAIALAHAEVEAAVREQIERGDLLGEKRRIVPG